MIKSYILYSISIISIIILSTLIIFSISLTKISPLNKIIFIIIGTLIALYIIMKLFISKHRYLYNTGAIISVIINIILIYNINILNNEYSVISNFFNNNYYYETYDIYVLKNTIYQEKNDLKNKKIGILKENSKNINNLLQNQIKANYSIYNSKEEAIYSLNNGEIQSIVIISSENSNSNLKSIYRFKVKKDKTNKDIY